MHRNNIDGWTIAHFICGVILGYVTNNIFIGAFIVLSWEIGEIIILNRLVFKVSESKNNIVFDILFSIIGVFMGIGLIGII